MAKIFLTGVTGFLGQFLAISLLRSGHHLIFLARDKDGLTAEERVRESLLLADMEALNFQNRWSVVEGDFDNLPEIVNAEEGYFVAGMTSFDKRHKRQIVNVNFEGTKKLLALAKRSGFKAVHYVSTVYIHQPGDSTVYEVPQTGKIFDNPYALSKRMAEWEVLGFSKRNPGCKVFIYRPSIVVGRRADGFTINFDGFLRYMYAYFRIGNSIAKRNAYSKDIHLPICVPGDPCAEINLVHIDYVVKLMSLIRTVGISGIYHLTNDCAPLYGALLEWSLKSLRIFGPSPWRNPGETKGDLFRIQKAIEKGVEEYMPFITSKTKFDKRNVKEVLGGKYIPHPPITRDTVATLMEFAIRCEFQKKKVSSVVTLSRLN